MSDRTARFGLPFLFPGQAQKEVFHNEALAAIDAALHASVLGSADAPPADPQEGDAWIVEAGAGGAWAGGDHSIAAWTESGWRFVRPRPGLSAWHEALGCRVHWDGAAWSEGALPATALQVGGLQVVGARQGAVAIPDGGAVVDIEARAAVAGVIAALMSHGLIE